jgi:hypothetical protein
LDLNITEQAAARTFDFPAISFEISADAEMGEIEEDVLMGGTGVPPETVNKRCCELVDVHQQTNAPLRNPAGRRI